LQQGLADIFQGRARVGGGVGEAIQGLAQPPGICSDLDANAGHEGLK